MYYTHLHYCVHNHVCIKIKMLHLLSMGDKLIDIEAYCTIKRNFITDHVVPLNYILMAQNCYRRKTCMVKIIMLVE